MKSKVMVAFCTALLVVACSRQLKVSSDQATVGGEAASTARPGEPATAESERIELSGSRIMRDELHSPVVLDDPMPMSIPAPPPAPPTPPRSVPVAPAPPADAAWPEDDLDIAQVQRSSPLQLTREQPFSTFSVDVDTGSYSQARQALSQGRLPSPFTVRTEEFLNYFDYGYSVPRQLAQPFSVTTELAGAPWNSDDTLLLIGVQGYAIDAARLPPANLVFLIDTSGSMQSADKLDLLKYGFRRLVEGLRKQDRVAIVAYAGSAGLVLPSTPGNQRGAILAALDRLAAGGATHGSAGIELAYEVAAEQMMSGGINRVILATDGDFNVGTTSVDALKDLVARKRDSGIALTTLGFGSWGYNGTVPEQLANVGNGHHAFIDDEVEAQRVLVTQMGATLLTIAKDVKIQVEFDPAVVRSYRLLGYENRALRREDFANDKVDAGEIGAGHSVTAIYQIQPTSVIQSSHQLATVRIRYKPPQSEVSQLIEQPIQGSAMQRSASDRLRFAIAVAGFAEKLRGSDALEEFGYGDVLTLLDAVQHKDLDEARAELRDLVELAESLAASSPGG